MQFNSYVFIFLFFPIFVILFALLRNQKLRKYLIVLSGIVFYYYGGGIKGTLLLLSSIGINTIFAYLLKKRKKKIILFIGVALNIIVLFAFKYTNFALSIINQVRGSQIDALDIILPLGISFFTYQHIMYLVSIYREDIQKIEALDYFTFILFFPKLLMGPLAEPKDFLENLNASLSKKVNIDNIAVGLKLFSTGLFKKLVFADTFSKAVEWGFVNQKAATSGDLFLVMLFYTFQIYFDFSGYSDMAVGISRMLGINLPMNFDSPYQAISIRDFWKRWHISLTRCLTRYLYIPLGGSRKGEVRTFVNILIVFLISGLWHGANWTFILWGLIHGLLQIAERIIYRNKKETTDKTVAKWMYTFLMVNLLWLLFRSDSITQWIGLLQKMFTFGNMSISEGLLNAFVMPESLLLFRIPGLSGLNHAVRGLSMLMYTVSGLLVCIVPVNNYRNMEQINYRNMVFYALLFIWSILCLSTETIFVYNNF